MRIAAVDAVRRPHRSRPARGGRDPGRRARRRQLTDASADGVDLCYGTFLSRHQYQSDVTDGNFVDARHA
jgi:hypothetical protein